MSQFMSLAAAVEANVRDGDTVAREGFPHLIPHAAGHEVIRQRRKHLSLIRMTPDLIYYQLIGMGGAGHPPLLPGGRWGCCVHRQSRPCRRLTWGPPTPAAHQTLPQPPEASPTSRQCPLAGKST